MKKNKLSWLRMIAVVVLTLCISCFGIGIFCTVVYREFGKEMQSNCVNDINAEYCYYIASTLANGDDINTAKKYIEENTNLQVAVIKTPAGEDGKAVDLADVDLDSADYIWGSSSIAKNSNYSLSSPVNECYNYNINEWFGAIKNANYSYPIWDNDENIEEDGAYEPVNSADSYHIFLQYDTNHLEKEDMYYDLDQFMYHFNNFAGDNALPLEILSVIVGIICVIIISFTLDGLTFWDKIPYAVYVGVMGCIVASGCVLVVSIWEELMSFSLVVNLTIWLVLVMVFLVVVTIESTIARIKARQFWRYTICYYIWKVCSYPFKKLKEYFDDDKKLFRKLSFIYAGLALLFFVSAIIFAAIGIDVYSVGPIVLWALMALIVLGVGWFFFAYQFKRLYEGTCRIRQGETDNLISLDKLKWVFKKQGENINTLGQGIDVAVQERMKSERFKTELITNVSHDIKTPLTSIINYVDLMKKEDITDPTMLEYMDVLDRQSSRLKKLIEDLMDASKASTGNLEVNLEECDVSVILGQAVGEFEDKMAGRNLVPIVTYPEQSINIMADGRHLWRVFDNLLSNICKYAQPDTRVYINVVGSETDSNVDIIFKNISSAQLNISSDELLERFVRGDSSRNTEGSGLGLSIANSLTELMNGKLILDVDGDLFKATVRFPRKCS